jgi:hypothetical protein
VTFNPLDPDTLASLSGPAALAIGLLAIVAVGMVVAPGVWWAWDRMRQGGRAVERWEDYL